MSQSQSFFNSNESSSIFSAIKSRKSAGGQAGCRLLYTSEVNYCSQCKSHIESGFTNSPAYDSKMVCELPNYGHLSSCWLKIRFAKATGTGISASATNFGVLTENAGAFCWNRARLIADGVVVAECFPEQVIAKYYKHSSDGKRRTFQQLVGGWKSNATHGSASKISEADPSLRAEAGSQTLYCPLPFFFDAIEENINKALPLGVLDRVFVELDMNQKTFVSHLTQVHGHLVTGLDIEDMRIVSVLTELSPDEERMYRASSFEAGGDPLSVLGYNCIKHEETFTNSGGSQIDFKVSMLSGQVGRLYIACLDNQHSTGEHNHFLNYAIESIILSANGVDMYKLDGLEDNRKVLEDWTNGDYSHDGEATNSSVNPAGIYVMDFKAIGGDKKSTSMSGSLNFSNLSAPVLKVKVSASIGYSNVPVAGNHSCKIVVLAEQHNIVSYATNNAGRTTIRSIS